LISTREERVKGKETIAKPKTKSQIVDHLTQKIGATKKGSCPNVG